MGYNPNLPQYNPNIPQIFKIPTIVYISNTHANPKKQKNLKSSPKKTKHPPPKKNTEGDVADLLPLGVYRLSDFGWMMDEVALVRVQGPLGVV